MTPAPVQNSDGLLGGAPARVVVDLDAIAKNTERLTSWVGSAEVLAIVKGDAYGHGLLPAARAAHAGGATWLGTAQLSDAKALRQAGIPGRILTWLHAPGADFAGAIERDIDLGVSTVDSLAAIVDAGRRVGKRARVHLKIDTGMARGGAYGSMWPALLESAVCAQRAGELDVVGLFSHLVASDVPDDPITSIQLGLFEAAEQDCQNEGLELEVTHLANSAGVLFHSQTHRNLVRPGLAIYGLNPAPELELPAEMQLQPAMSLTANVAVTKRVSAGQGVSYNHTWSAPRETTLADVPIGYADGLPRHASNAGPMLVNGHRTHIVGRVCMDQCVVDMGDVEVHAGAEAVLFGRSSTGEQGPTVQEWADAAGTISWEIVTRISTRLPRVYVGQLAKEFGL